MINPNNSRLRKSKGGVSRHWQRCIYQLVGPNVSPFAELGSERRPKSSVFVYTVLPTMLDAVKADWCHYSGIEREKK